MNNKLENDMNIKLIDVTSPDYVQELALRDAVLRRPIGLSIYDENLADEVAHMHIGCFRGSKLCGILILTPLDETTLKMRQVAVAADMQHRRIGTKLVKYAESIAKVKGYTKITLNSRISAKDFYLKHDYIETGDIFYEVGIPHIRMIKGI